MALSNIILTKIKEEIDTDPKGLGYSGKTDQEVADLMNSPYKIDIPAKEMKPARIHQILFGDGPNSIGAVKTDDILNAQAKIDEEVAKDPKGRGYSGKPTEQVKQLLDEPYEVDVIIKERQPARINQILLGVAKTPNAVTPQDIHDAKQV